MTPDLTALRNNVWKAVAMKRPFRIGGTWKGLTGPSFRPKCPECGKKGMSPWKAAAVLGQPLLHRDCRYCHYSETKEV